MGSSTGLGYWLSRISVWQWLLVFIWVSAIPKLFFIARVHGTFEEAAARGGSAAVESAISKSGPPKDSIGEALLKAIYEQGANETIREEKSNIAVVVRPLADYLGAIVDGWTYHWTWSGEADLHIVAIFLWGGISLLGAALSFRSLTIGEPPVGAYAQLCHCLPKVLIASLTFVMTLAAGPYVVGAVTGVLFMETDASPVLLTIDATIIAAGVLWLRRENTGKAMLTVLASPVLVAWAGIFVSIFKSG